MIVRDTIHRCDCAVPCEIVNAHWLLIASMHFVCGAVLVCHLCTVLYFTVLTLAYSGIERSHHGVLLLCVQLGNCISLLLCAYGQVLAESELLCGLILTRISHNCYCDLSVSGALLSICARACDRRDSSCESSKVNFSHWGSLLEGQQHGSRGRRAAWNGIMIPAIHAKVLLQTPCCVQAHAVCLASVVTATVGCARPRCVALRAVVCCCRPVICACCVSVWSRHMSCLTPLLRDKHLPTAVSSGVERCASVHPCTTCSAVVLFCCDTATCADCVAHLHTLILSPCNQLVHHMQHCWSSIILLTALSTL